MSAPMIFKVERLDPKPLCSTWPFGRRDRHSIQRLGDKPFHQS
jgi:hypothetical protein